MKKRILLLTLIVCAFLMIGSVSVFAAEEPAASVAIAEPMLAVPSDDGFFWDVEPREWYYNYIGFVGRHGIFNGYGDGEFRPKQNMTRAEVVRVLFTLDGSPSVTVTDRFSDVAQDAWYADEVEWAVSNGIVTGYPEGTFCPDNFVSRQDFVTMLYRFANYKEYDTTGRAELNFPDVDDTNEYAIEAFAWAIDSGIISGTVEYDGIYLRPAASTTRAQVAKMLSVVAVEYENLGATTNVTILTSENDLTVGCSRLLQYAVAPYETAFDEMTWTSSNEDVVTVSRGIITGVSAGTAVVTATTFDGNFATCNVTVTEEPVDPYGDVADFVELNYNAGQWNENPSITFSGTEDGVTYEYSICMDAATGSIYFETNLYDPESDIEFEISFLTMGNSEDVIGFIELTDYFENVIWIGESYFEASEITGSSQLDVDYFHCTDSLGAIPEMQDYLGETLTMELHSWLVDLDDIFADWGLKTTIKDFGFVNY